jgi:sugar phosphate isomerase/epimerase
MINSGGNMDNVEDGLAALADSVEQLYDYAAGKNYPFTLFMEPCDSIIDAFHLVGPYRRAVDFAARMRGRGFPLELTMDSAHTAEQNEDFAEALAATKPYCRHIHFANCRIADPKDELYGDKHLGLEYSGSVWTPETLGTLFPTIEKLYPGDEPVRIALEILCRENDPYAYFEKTWDSVPFLTKS